MDIKNVVLLVVQLFLLLLTSVCVIFCTRNDEATVSVFYSGVISDKETAESFIKYCQGKNEKDHGYVRVFDKYGKTYGTLDQIRTWDLEKEERDKRMDTMKEYSDLYEQLNLRNVVQCDFSDKRGLVHFALVKGTADVSVCEKFRKYYETKIN